MTLCSLNNLSFAYKQGKPLLKNISLEIKKGECLAILGGSGSGKSTLGYLLAGFLHPTHGEILWADEMQAATPLGQALKKQMVFQDPSSALTPFYTPYKTLYEILKLHFPLSHEELEAQVKKHLILLGLSPELFHKKNRLLSGGEKQRLALARAFCLQPKLLILDEPISSCDLFLQKTILTLLKEKIHDLQITVVVVLHDIHHARFLADKICLLHEGQIEAYGTKETFFTGTHTPYTEMFLEAFS
jgi:ABC-type dipeptide/oligopeptide/nickel transport system ATPase subunit